MPDRRILTGIAPTAWEHPADRAALNTLRALPGFDEVVRKVAGAIGERGLRNLFLANAVRVGPTQRPKLDAMLSEVCTTLDWADRPQLYVSQNPYVNAAAIGFEHPFIVINSETLRVLDDDERRFIVAHEVGHIMSGHTTYSTIAIILMTIGLSNLPFLAGVALLPFQLALLEWYRKAELSCDRAGLLGTQDLRACMSAFMKMAGGEAPDDVSDLEAFMLQAEEYETEGSAWDTTLKLLNTVFRDHPFATVRAAELQRWVRSGEYQRIIDGDYPRRGEPTTERPLKEDFIDAAGYYGARTRDVVSQLGGVLDRARDAFNQTFRGPNK